MRDPSARRIFTQPLAEVIMWLMTYIYIYYIGSVADFFGQPTRTRVRVCADEESRHRHPLRVTAYKRGREKNKRILQTQDNAV